MSTSMALQNFLTSGVTEFFVISRGGVFDIVYLDSDVSFSEGWSPDGLRHWGLSLSPGAGRIDLRSG